MKYVIAKAPNGFVADITYDDNIYEHHKNIRDFEDQLIKEEQEGKIEQEMSNDVREWQITAPHEYVGNIYGYPKCCIDAYSEHMRTGIFPEKSISQDQIPEELYCISHTPCSINCKESLELGRKCMDTLERMRSISLENIDRF